jgi:hypothetical protein
LEVRADGLMHPCVLEEAAKWVSLPRVLRADLCEFGLP